MSRRGFTLIELLIVVAIIAILAAIAVPNFLEAQVRSKVSRTHNDLRSIATALEAYRVDNNRYPPATLYDSLVGRLRKVTTPVAYITSVANDPFYKYSTTNFAGDQPYYVYAPGNIYQVGNPQEYLSYDKTIYSLAGRGPDLHYNYGGLCMAHPLAIANGSNIIGSYDPTNGTTSEGDILRLGTSRL